MSSIELKIAHGKDPVTFVIPFKKAKDSKLLQETIHKRSGTNELKTKITIFDERKRIIDWDDWEDLIEEGQAYFADLTDDVPELSDAVETKASNSNYEVPEVLSPEPIPISSTSHKDVTVPTRSLVAPIPKAIVRHERQNVTTKIDEVDVQLAKLRLQEQQLKATQKFVKLPEAAPPLHPPAAKKHGHSIPRAEEKTLLTPGHHERVEGKNYVTSKATVPSQPPITHDERHPSTIKQPIQPVATSQRTVHENTTTRSILRKVGRAIITPAGSSSPEDTSENEAMTRLQLVLKHKLTKPINERNNALSVPKDFTPEEIIKVLGRNPAYTNLLVLDPSENKQKYWTIDIIVPDTPQMRQPIAELGWISGTRIAWEHVPGAPQPEQHTGLTFSQSNSEED